MKKVYRLDVKDIQQAVGKYVPKLFDELYGEILTIDFFEADNGTIYAEVSVK